MSDQHGIYSGVVDIARNGVNEVIRLRALNAELVEALRIAEAGLADIGDADREPGDDLAWCEQRAAQALPTVRAALAKVEAGNGS